ncbi:amidohydrolase family protein [Roseovarius sp. MMSF_3350]|uniref:amidohydrolase family protein n=1 Tax=Roseovarius sp. MMSF_3350 TaxID=3046706 RepID=UPI00273FB743|nr:amidohydrolase family protein [Roseovarius sp. MMSF_3350]
MSDPNAENSEVCAPFDPEPALPAHRPPPGACDCHAHIVERRKEFPFAGNRSYTPSPASLTAYQHMLGRLGLHRAVIVQPSFYGTDNRVTMQAISKAGSDFRAVVVTDENISDRDLLQLNSSGARGARINLLFKGGSGIKDLPRYAARLGEIGWHIQFLVDVSHNNDSLWQTLKHLPCDLVFDHMGHVPVHKGTGNAGFQKLLRFLDTGKVWVKLSGAYRITAEPKPPYHDTAPFARLLIENCPDRMLWGTDWPHPQIPVPMPNDGALLDLLWRWVQDDLTYAKILKDNPAQLYGFG